MHIGCIVNKYTAISYGSVESPQTWLHKLGHLMHVNHFVLFMIKNIMIKNKALTQKQIKVARKPKKKPWGLNKVGLPQSKKKKVNSNSEATIKGKIQWRQG